jgi:phosphoribosyl 1,2-cyclic phosphodiesterase
MEISVIASGSNGNSCLIENKDDSILIDAGKSCREIEYRLSKMGKSLESLNGIILSHSHSDHSSAVGVISRKYNVPVYSTKDVYEESVNRIGKVNIKHFIKNSEFRIGETKIKPINTSHDVPSCGFVVGKFGLFTDTGIITDELNKILPKLQGVLIESNHDIDMLLNGPYPAFLKQRILSDYGHLSNISASQFIQKKGDNLNFALLGHLSGNNNTLEKAKITFESLVKKKIDHPVLSRDKGSGIWDL